MKRKDFKQENPALAFINTGTAGETSEEGQPTEKARAASYSQAPEGYRPNPEYIETKSKRVQLLLQPSVYDALKHIAATKGQSFNETVSEALRNFIEKEGKI